jgi:hypothetical protein
MEAWSTPQARRLISVMTRDGLIHDARFRAAILDATGHMAGQFTRWAESGRLPEGVGDPQDLAYSLMSPIAHARLLWLHEAAAPEEIETALLHADRSTEIFIRTVFGDGSRR